MLLQHIVKQGLMLKSWAGKKNYLTHEKAGNKFLCTARLNDKLMLSWSEAKRARDKKKEEHKSYLAIEIFIIDFASPTPPVFFHTRSTCVIYPSLLLNAWSRQTQRHTKTSFNHILKKSQIPRRRICCSYKHKNSQSCSMMKHSRLINVAEAALIRNLQHFYAFPCW